MENMKLDAFFNLGFLFLGKKKQKKHTEEEEDGEEKMPRVR